jgi:mycofactocin precursor
MADDATVELADEAAVTDPGDEVADDVLVEEVSIDGMCGVY